MTKRFIKIGYFSLGLVLGSLIIYFATLHFMAPPHEAQSSYQHVVPQKPVSSKIKRKKRLKLTIEQLWALPQKLGDPLSTDDVKKLMQKMAVRQYKQKSLSFLTDTTVDWIASLAPENSYSVLKLLRALPVEVWQENIATLQQMPEEDLRQHLMSRVGSDISCNERTDVCHVL